MHSALPLVWNADAASFAASYVSGCPGNGSTLIHSGNSMYGENLGLGYSDFRYKGRAACSAYFDRKGHVTSFYLPCHTKAGQLAMLSPAAELCKWYFGRVLPCPQSPLCMKTAIQVPGLVLLSAFISRIVPILCLRCSLPETLMMLHCNAVPSLPPGIARDRSMTTAIQASAQLPATSHR